MLPQVKHFAGDVVYNVAEFPSKNDDSLNPDLEADWLTSEKGLVKTILEMGAGTRDGSKAAKAEAAVKGGNGGKKSGPKAIASVGRTFLSSLESLMGELKQADAHFVRCIKVFGLVLACPPCRAHTPRHANASAMACTRVRAHAHPGAGIARRRASSVRVVPSQWALTRLTAVQS